MTHQALQENNPSINDQLQLLVAGGMGQVDQLIDGYLKSDVPLIEQAAKHIIYSGGKRLRPSLVILSSLIYGHVSSSTIALAAAVEFIHTATLLHDDVIDESGLRRGKDSAHKIWGNTAAILVGDYLFARAFELMVKTGDLRVLDILSQASAIITAGEVRQLVESHSLDLTVESCLEIMGAKTSALFGAACQAGALVAGASVDQAQSMYTYGYNLGLIFQIADDILDYCSEDASRGKIPGDDFREGKITLPLVFAYQDAPQEDRDLIHRTFVEFDQCAGDFEAVRAMIDRNHGFERARQLAETLIMKVKQEIGFVDTNQDVLVGLLDECLNRYK